MSASRQRPVTTVIGAGRLARALLPQLIDAGYPVGAVFARRRGAARSLVRNHAGVRATTSARNAVAGASLVLVAVPDRAIAEIAEQLAVCGDWPGRVVLHHAGALGPEALDSLSRTGAAVGVLHPLQVLGDARIAARILPGSRARIEGDPAAIRTARGLARDLGMIPLTFPEPLTSAQREAYHAAAALVSNDLLGLLGLGVSAMGQAGLPADEALAAILPLVRGTLAQLAEGGFGAALTGPAVRGDLDTLRRHLVQLAGASENAAEVHRMLSLEVLKLARDAGLPVPSGLPRRLRRL